MKGLKFSILLSLLFLAFSLKAQQFPMYSQYVFNEYIINPAAAGTIDKTPLRMTYRDQWSGFTNLQGDNIAPKTFTFSGHTPLTDKHAIGGFVYSDVTGPISQTSAQLSYSWRTCLDKPGSCSWDKRRFLSFSYATRLIQFAYDDTETISWNEFFGLANDPVLPNTIETDFFISHSFGTYYYTEKFYAGFSAHNLGARALKIESDILFNNRLTTEYNFMTGAYIPITYDQDLGVEPSVLIKKTGWSKTQIDFTTRFIYMNNVWAGFGYRTAENALSLLLGFEFAELFVGYCYDTAVEGISNYSSGTHEIAIGFDLGTFSAVDNVRLRSRFKKRRMLVNPFNSIGQNNRRGTGS